MAPAQKRQLMVVSHSHWDREWYLPFEAFRARLVGMLSNTTSGARRPPANRLRGGRE
jgi:alpha-mannosidase